MRIENELKLDYKDVLLRPKRSTIGSRSLVNLRRKFTFKHSENTFDGIPIMASNMDGVGTIKMSKVLTKLNLFTVLVKSSNNVVLDAASVSISTGITDHDKLRVGTLLEENPFIRYVCVDVANGYSERFLEFISEMRVNHPRVTIIAGNVVTPDVTEELILRGADIVKVGIGPGSVCTTRIKTGVGYPQLSAVIECADAAHGLDAHIIADGGCTSPGDVVKAFAAGADFVMLGGMLAGCDEGGGTIEDDKVKFYGMSSKEAQGNDFKDYRSSEGRVVEVPYRGPVEPVVGDILGGLRSACTYVGARSIKQLSKCATFIRVSNQFNDVYLNRTVGD
jgi:GMP reductase